MSTSYPNNCPRSWLAMAMIVAAVSSAANAQEEDGPQEPELVRQNAQARLALQLKMRRYTDTSSCSDLLSHSATDWNEN